MVDSENRPETPESLAAEFRMLWELSRRPKIDFDALLDSDFFAADPPESELGDVVDERLDELMDKAPISESFKDYVRYELGEYERIFDPEIDWMSPDPAKSPLEKYTANGGIFNPNLAKDIEKETLSIYEDLASDYHIEPSNSYEDSEAQIGMLNMEGVMISRRYLAYHLGSRKRALNYERMGVVMALSPVVPIEVNLWIKDFKATHEA